METKIKLGSHEWWVERQKEIDEPTCKIRGLLIMEDPSMFPSYPKYLSPALKHLEEALELIDGFIKFEEAVEREVNSRIKKSEEAHDDNKG